MIKIGIVGTGGMARQRAKLFDQIQDTSVVGVCSRNIENTRQLCDLTGAEGFEDYNKMLQKIDAVIVCTANHVHGQFALQALSAAKHVLVVYPLSTTLKGADELRTAAGDSDCVLMVGNTIIHEAMFQYLAAHKGKLGRILSASSRVALYDKRISSRWYMNPQQAGPVFAVFHYHHIEYYRHFLGQVQWVLGCDQSIENNDKPGCNSVAGGTLIMGHGDGATSCVQWYLSDAGDGLPRGLWLNGTEGSVTVVSKDAQSSQVVWDHGGDGKLELLEDQWGVEGSCNDYVKAIAGNLDHKTRLDSDITTLTIGSAASKSANRQEIIHI